MALAAALLAAARIKQKAAPQVLIPAYSCPDIVSAALYAGYKPILVDLEEQTPWLDLDDLAAKINDHTVAIVPVNLFGIRERIASIRKIADQRNILVIEDSAQLFPESPKKCAGQAHFVILSFGRGKPVSLLEGGAVLHIDNSMAAYLPNPVADQWHRWLQAAQFRMRIVAYNVFLSPYLYSFVSTLPFLKIGETQFNQLTSINHAKMHLISTLPANIASHQRRGQALQDSITKMITELRSDAIVNLAQACCGDNLPQLLRYPVLVLRSKLRQKIFKRLRRAGLGVSRMYPTPLTSIRGLEVILKSQGSFPNAENFSKMILTLPTHCRLKNRDAAKIRRIVEELLS